MFSTYKQIIFAMGRVGILGFGGGPSVIPLFRYEAVTRYQWVKDEEFGEILAIANALPGPIATKMAAYLGYKQKGAIGALLSVLAHIIPTIIATVALLSLVHILQFSKSFKDMISAVMPVIAIMLGQMAYEFGAKAVKGLGLALGAFVLVLSYLMLNVFSVQPAIVILLFLVYGAFHFKLKHRFSKGRGME